MAINTRKVLIGGFVAGIVLNLIDYLGYGVILADRMKTESNAFKAGLGDQMSAMTSGQLAGYVIMDFIVGFLLVWTYAAIRPRFGPGAKTATYVALLFWIFGLITTSGFMQMGMTSSGLWWTLGLIWLVNLLLSSIVGARIYTEESAA